MEKISGSRRWPWRLALSLVAALVMSGPVVAGSAQAATVHVADRYGRSVRVPSYVVTKLKVKHDVDVATLARWLPKSRLAKANGTRREYRVRLARVRCERFPILGRVCWRTGDVVPLLSVVDYRTNRQGLQQGLITAYCDGLRRCPGWVNRVSSRAGGGGAGGGGGGGW